MTLSVAHHGSELQRLNEEVKDHSLKDCRLAQPKFYQTFPTTSVPLKT